MPHKTKKSESQPATCGASKSAKKYTKVYLKEIAKACHLDVKKGEKKDDIVLRLEAHGVVFPEPKLSAYNEFMRDEIRKINQRTKHSLPPRQVFKKAATAYQTMKKKEKTTKKK